MVFELIKLDEFLLCKITQSQLQLNSARGRVRVIVSVCVCLDAIVYSLYTASYDDTEAATVRL